MEQLPPKIHCLPPRPLIGGSLINKEAYQDLSQLKHFSIPDGDYKESASDQELEQALHEELQHLDNHHTTTDVDSPKKKKGHKNTSSSRAATSKTHHLDTITTTTTKTHQHHQKQQRWSTLSADEHSWYLSHINALDDLSAKDAARMMSLIQAVSKEREEYKKAVLSTWLPPTLPALDAMSGRQKSQVEEDVKQRHETVARQYARYWKFHSILPLKSSKNNCGNKVSKEDSLFLATTGNPPVLQIPPALDGGVPVSLPTTLSYLPATIAICTYNKARNTVHHHHQHQQPSKKQKTGLKHRSDSGSKKNAAVVIERPYRKAPVTPLHEFVEDEHPLYKPNSATTVLNSPTLLMSSSTIMTPGTIVADASALIAIASTPLMSHYQDRQLQKSWCWEIPVTVDGKGRVLIEKPLHPRAVTKRALMTRLYKYAALSVLLPEPLAEIEEGDEEAGGEGNKGGKRGKTNSVKSSRPSAKPASKTTSTQTTVSSPSPRQTMFGKVKVGEHHVLIRSHAMYHVSTGNTSLFDNDDAAKEKYCNGQVPVVIGIKSDYLETLTTNGGDDDGEVEEEIFSELEVCHWLLKLLFCPGAEGVMVARVHVPHSKLVSCEYLSRGELEESLDTGPCLDFLSSVLTGMKQQQLRTGRYILSPVGGQDNMSIAVYAVSDDDKTAGGTGGGGGGTAPGGGGGTSTHVTVLPLPCGGTTTTVASMQQQQQQQGGRVIYDLHEALRLSGRMTILPQHAFLPPRWHPYRFGGGNDDDDDDEEDREEMKMSHIPDTFPPIPKDRDKAREERKNKKGKGKRKGKKSGGGGGWEEGKKGRRRKRQRRLLPHAWSVLGKGGDFDSLMDQQQKPMDMSRKSYMDQLEEEI